MGYPGRALSLLSAGIDSPVATWLMMKRGCEMVSLHIDGGSYAGSDVRTTAERHHAMLSTWCAGFPMDLLVVDAEIFYEAITRTGPPDTGASSARGSCWALGALSQKIAIWRHW